MRREVARFAKPPQHRRFHFETIAVRLVRTLEYNQPNGPWRGRVITDQPQGALMDPNEFRRLGHDLVEWIAGYRERMPELPVMSPGPAR